VFVEMVREIKTMGGSLTLYASRRDQALRFSGWLRKLPRAGFIKGRPLIVAGVDTIDITNAGTDLFALNHDIYSASPTIVGDMRRIFEGGERPPDRRTEEFAPVASNEGTYWRLRPPNFKATT
jgi:esterase/lipase superfamily enzyme